MFSFKNTERIQKEHILLRQKIINYFKNTKRIHSFKNTISMHSFKNTNFELKFFTCYFQTDQCLSFIKSFHMTFIIKNKFHRRHHFIKYT